MSLLKFWSSTKKKTKPKESTRLQAKHQRSNFKYDFSERYFYVVFADTSAHIFSRFLKKGFGHCYCIEQTRYVWLLIDPTRFGLNIAVPECLAQDPLIENIKKLEPDLKILQLVTKGIGTNVLKPKLLTCVSALEYVMGINLGCITPYGLYKKLLAKKHPGILKVREL